MLISETLRSSFNWVTVIPSGSPWAWHGVKPQIVAPTSSRSGMDPSIPGCRKRTPQCMHSFATVPLVAKPQGRLPKDADMTARVEMSNTFALLHAPGVSRALQ